MIQNKKQERYDFNLKHEKAFMKQSYQACFGSEGTPILNTRMSVLVLAYFRKRGIVGEK